MFKKIGVIFLVFLVLECMGIAFTSEMLYPFVEEKVEKTICLITATAEAADIHEIKDGSGPLPLEKEYEDLKKELEKLMKALKSLEKDFKNKFKKEILPLIKKEIKRLRELLKDFNLEKDKSEPLKTEGKRI